jgi:hypothetical protein
MFFCTHLSSYLPMLFLPIAQPTPQMRGYTGVLYIEARKQEDIRNQQQ